MAEWKSLKSKVVEGGAYFRGGAYFPSCTSQMVLIFVVGAYFRAGLLSRGYGKRFYIIWKYFHLDILGVQNDVFFMLDCLEWCLSI